MDDIGNADRFVWQHRDSVRYVPVFRRWLVWDGRRWLPDETNTPLRLARDTARSLEEEATGIDDDTARGRLLAHARVSAREPRLRATLKIAECDRALVLRPAELDADPWLLNALNGTVDLRSGELRSHRRGDAITLLAGAAYHPDAEAPTWQAHVKRCQPDPEVRSFLQRLAGYSAIGVTREHILPISHGPGANGKSTTHNAIKTALGDYGHQAAPGLLTQPSRSSGQPTPELADLRGRRLVIATETREDHQLAVERVKAITGGDPITARHLYGNPFTFPPSHTAWLQTNHKPRITDTGHAIWRRVHLIPWTVTIPDGEQNKKIDRQLALELDGILAWIVQGALDYQKHGLNPPATVTAATRQYKHDEDTLAAFLEQHTQPNLGSRTQSSTLLGAYNDWAKTHGAPQLSRNMLADRMTEKGHTRTRVNGRSYWTGLQLTQKGDPDG